MELAGSELGRLVAAARPGSARWRRWGKVDRRGGVQETGLAQGWDRMWRGVQWKTSYYV